MKDTDKRITGSEATQKKAIEPAPTPVVSKIEQTGLSELLIGSGSNFQEIVQEALPQVQSVQTDNKTPPSANDLVLNYYRNLSTSNITTTPKATFGNLSLEELSPYFQDLFTDDLQLSTNSQKGYS